MNFYESIHAAAEKNPRLNDVHVFLEEKETSLRSRFGLWLNKSYPQIGKAQTESNLVYVPASDKPLNLTRALDGKIHYRQRTIQMQFTVMQPKAMWETIRSELETALQGQWLKFLFTEDPSWTWTGLFDVELTPGEYQATATITVTACPYKTSVTAAAGSDWLWDTFNFETDTIYDTSTEVGRL